MSTPPTTTGGMATPDPLLTYESFAALAATIITNLIVLFELNISDARQASLLSLVNAAYVVAMLIYSSVVRNGRSRSLAPVTPVVAATGPLPAQRVG